MTKKKVKPIKKEFKMPTFKERQDEFVERVNKIGEELGIAITAKLNVTENGIVPKLFLADVLKKPKKK